METIRAYIEAHTESIEDIQLIAEHGCVSWCFTKLVWYNQTMPFFDKHYSEIMDIVYDFQESTWCSLDDLIPHKRIKNDLARFAVEQVARTICDEKGLY